MKRVALLLILVLLSPAAVSAKTECIDTDGEAVIVSNDIPSAKAEAIARAKWSAIEQVVGVDVKAQSVVQNLQMVDEAISREIKGAISKFKVLGQKVTEETITVSINACVEATKAKETVAGLAQNSALAVFILAKDAPSDADGSYQESNALSETLIGNLTSQGYTVIDIAPTQALDSKVVDATIRSGKLIELRPLMYKFLTNIMLIGKVDYTVSTKKGQDIGYGISMPFNNVTARLTYRMISKNASGNLVILEAGTEQGKGLASSVEDAAAESLQDLAKKLTPTILDKVGKHLKGVAKRVEVKVNGITDLRDNFAIKEDLQNLAWVTEVEEKGLGEFTVSYPENPIYLANSLSQKDYFQLQSFTPTQIRLNYIKHK